MEEPKHFSVLYEDSCLQACCLHAIVFGVFSLLLLDVCKSGAEINFGAASRVIKNSVCLNTALKLPPRFAILGTLIPKCLLNTSANPPAVGIQAYRKFCRP